jgi:hypothetical protein
MSRLHPKEKVAGASRHLSYPPCSGGLQRRTQKEKAANIGALRAVRFLIMKLGIQTHP